MLVGDPRLAASILPILAPFPSFPRRSGATSAVTYPRAGLITIHDGAHSVWVDDPAVIDDLDAFVDGGVARTRRRHDAKRRPKPPFVRAQSTRD